MSGFNGFTELQKRADAGEKIIDCLERYNPANVSSTRSRSADFPVLRIDYINKLLELGGFTIQDSIRYKNIILEKEYELAQIPVPISDSALDDSFDDMDDIYIYQTLAHPIEQRKRKRKIQF